MISPSLYKEIADLIDSAQSKGEKIVSEILNMKNILENSEIPSYDVDRQYLESTIDSTYNKMNSLHVQIDPKMLSFVAALQNHIAIYYGSLNDFLFNNGIVVKTYFASISEATGNIINSENIEEIS